MKKLDLKNLMITPDSDLRNYFDYKNSVSCNISFCTLHFDICIITFNPELGGANFEFCTSLSFQIKPDIFPQVFAIKCDHGGILVGAFQSLPQCGSH